MEDIQNYKKLYEDSLSKQQELQRTIGNIQSNLHRKQEELSTLQTQLNTINENNTKAVPQNKYDELKELHSNLQELRKVESYI